MPEDRFLIIEMKARQDCYPLPKGCGEVVSVKFADREYQTIFLMFEAPTIRSWLRVFALDKVPETPEEARNLLKRAYTRITYSPVWTRMNDELYIYPKPVNDGEYLILTVEQ